MKVSAITAVQRRSDGMRVKGLIDSGVDYRGGYGGHAYQGAGGVFNNRLYGLPIHRYLPAFWFFAPLMTPDGASTATAPSVG